MAKYFKIVGGLLLLSFIVGAIMDLAYLFTNISYLTRSHQEYLIALFIIVFVMCLFLGPALGLLFVSYGKHLEDAAEKAEQERKKLENEKSNKEKNEIGGQTVILLRDVVDQISGTFIPKGTIGKVVTDYGEYYRVHFLVNNTPVSILEKKEFFSF